MSLVTLTAVQLALIEYASDPNHGSWTSFASKHDISEETVRRWRKESWFTEGVDARMREMHLGPESVMAVMKGVQEKAATGDVQAAKLYWQFLERLQPMKQTVGTGKASHQE